MTAWWSAGAPRELAPGVGAAFTPDGCGVVYAAFSPETTWGIWLRGQTTTGITLVQSWFEELRRRCSRSPIRGQEAR